MKRKYKRIFVVAFIVLLSLLSVTLVYALINVQYDYLLKPIIPNVNFVMEGNNLTVSDNTNDDSVTVSTVDIICDNGEINSLETYLIDTFEKENFTRYIYTNVPVGTYTVQTGTNVKYVFINTCIYTDENPVDVTFNNVYVKSVQDVKLACGEKHYNSIFNDFNRNKANYKTIYFVNDFEFDEAYKINVPTSLNFLDSHITLNKKLELNHTNNGRYYISIDNQNVISKIENLFIKCPNAYYDFNTYFSTQFEMYNSSNYIGKGIEYSMLLDDALEYAETIIPKYIYNDLILPRKYRSMDVKYKYSIDYGDGNFKDLTSGRFDFTNASQSCIIKVEAISEVDKSSKELNIDCILSGNDLESFGLGIKNNLDNYVQEYNMDIDIYNAIKNVYNSPQFKDNEYEINIYLNDGIDLNTIYFSDLYTKDLLIQLKNDSIIYNDNVINQLVIRRGAASAVSSNVIEIEVKKGSSTYRFDYEMKFMKPTLEELSFFLKTKISPFITMTTYDIVNIYDDKLMLGKKEIADSTLGIDNLNFKIVDNNDPTNTDLTNSYFEIIKNNTSICSLLILDGVTFDNFSLYYYIIDENGDEVELFKQPVIRTMKLLTDGTVQFESSNPFDNLFSGDTNWLDDKGFDISDSEIFDSTFVRMEIVSINGIPYNEDLVTSYKVNEDLDNNGVQDIYNVNIGRMISVQFFGDNTRNYEGNEFYKKLNVDINMDFIPNYNSTIVINCIAINEISDSDDLQLLAQKEYTITIPGIFKCGMNDDSIKQNKQSPYIFHDDDVYNMMIENLKGSDDEKYYIYSKGTSNIIRSDSVNYNGVKNGIEEGINFTTYVNTPSYHPDTIKDIKGIENYTNVNKMIFSDMKILSMSPFEYYNGEALKEIYLNNCGLDDTATFNATSGNSYIYGIQLEKIDFGNNHIDTIKNFAFRTVKYLNLSNQTSKVNGTYILSNVDDLRSLSKLEELDISKNSVERFNELKYINTLKILYTYDNNSSYDVNMLGALGKLNYGPYIWMIKANKCKIFNETPNASEDNYLQIISEEKDIYASYEISKEISDAYTALNCFVSPIIFNTNETATFENSINKLNTPSSDATSTTLGYIYKFADFNLNRYSNMFLYNTLNQELVTNTNAYSGIPCFYILTIYKTVTVEEAGETITRLELLAARDFFITLNDKYTKPVKENA